MTAGTIKFYVDDVECPDTSGVGVNAVGGLFNCGLTGFRFKAICTTTCTPNFAIRELKLWQAKVMNVYANNDFYVLPGNTGSYNLSKLFLTGTYSTNDISTAFVLSAGTISKTGVCMGLPKKAHVT